MIKHGDRSPLDRMSKFWQTTTTTKKTYPSRYRLSTRRQFLVYRHESTVRQNGFSFCSTHQTGSSLQCCHIPGGRRRHQSRKCSWHVPWPNRRSLGTFVRRIGNSSFFCSLLFVLCFLFRFLFFFVVVVWFCVVVAAFHTLPLHSRNWIRLSDKNNEKCIVGKLHSRLVHQNKTTLEVCPKPITPPWMDANISIS